MVEYIIYYTITKLKNKGKRKMDKETQKALEAMENRLVKRIKDEVTLKVKESVKDEIVSTVLVGIHEVRDEVKDVKNEIKGLREEIATGNLQTHNLLSNIAEILNKNK